MSAYQLDFTGRVAVVTGAGRGLGRAIALALAARGAKLVVNDFGCDLDGTAGGTPGPAATVCDEIRGAGGEAEAVVADIGSDDGVQQTMARALDRFGRCDIVVHNASPVMPQSPFEDASREGFELSLRVNAGGAWNLAKQAWPQFKRQGYGRMVLITSAAGLWGRGGMPAYSLAKSALTGLAGYLAAEGGAHGIRVNALAPVVATRAWQGQNVPDELVGLAPAEPVAQAVVLLAHDACPVNGALFQAAGTVLARVFTGQTAGYVAPGGTAEAFLDGWPRVMDTGRFVLPHNADDSGAYLFAAMAAAGAAATTGSDGPA